MKKLFFALGIAALFAGCIHHEDFEFAGTVVDCEACTSMEMGYAVALDFPDSVGRDYVTSENTTYHNVVVIYGSDRILKQNQDISGKIYIDNDHSDAYCSFHYRHINDVPECLFTELNTR